MVVEIDQEFCTGCGICVESCPCDVIRVDKERGKAIAKYSKDCMLCELCSYFCPEDCIQVTPEKYYPPPVSWEARILDRDG